MMEASAQEKQSILSALAEYLTQEGYEATLGCLQSECASQGVELGDGRTTGEGNSPEMVEILECFELGEREAFFTLWDQEVPSELRSQDPTCLNVEFNLSLYFAVHCYRHGLDHKAEAEKHAFKTYLETRGSALAQTEEFVSYYALPYVPDPRVHPSFKLLFSDSWTAELGQRLRDFLGNVFASKQQAEVPRLVQMYRDSVGGKPSSSTQEAEAVKMELADAQQKYTKVRSKLQEITRSYHSLVGISTEMVTALETAVKEKMVSPEFLTKMCTKLFGGSAAQSLDVTRPGTATSLLRASIALPPPSHRGGVSPISDAPLLPSLNFPVVRQDLVSQSNSDKAAILQALRWRLTKAIPGEQRDTVTMSYVHHDLLGFTATATGNYQDFVLRLVQSNDPVVAEQMARLLNTLSSLKLGRVYVSDCPPVLSALVQQLRVQNFVDGPIQMNIVGALQKLSLRRGCQNAMIELQLVGWLVELLAEHAPTLSEYSFHYSLALLMNLALRNKGRLSCLRHSSPLLRLLGDLLEHEDQEVRSYVHGILYSILSIEQVREEARAMGMGAMLRSAVQSSPPDLVSQLNYIVEQLNCDTAGDMSASDVDDDDTDDGDDDEEDDPDVIDGDEGEVEPLVHGDGLSGEMLLSNRYLGVMTSAPLPTSKSVKRLKEEAHPHSAPLSRPVTPQTFGNKTATPLPPPAEVHPSQEQPLQHKQAFVSRPKIPRTPDGNPPAVQRQDPPPPTPSQSPPTAPQRPHTRSGRGSKQQ